ncbi:MAG: hypothetical protein P4M11_11655 [Candidatus Pacebacteria bacterium]|nr:hypothetical protein [Candidatus Paceibacterota bacterium]
MKSASPQRSDRMWAACRPLSSAGSARKNCLRFYSRYSNQARPSANPRLEAPGERSFNVPILFNLCISEDRQDPRQSRLDRLQRRFVVSFSQHKTQPNENNDLRLSPYPFKPSCRPPSQSSYSISFADTSMNFKRVPQPNPAPPFRPGTDYEIKRGGSRNLCWTSFDAGARGSPHPKRQRSCIFSNEAIVRKFSCDTGEGLKTVSAGGKTRENQSVASSHQRELDGEAKAKGSMRRKKVVKSASVCGHSADGIKYREVGRDARRGKSVKRRRTTCP